MRMGPVDCGKADGSFERQLDEATGPLTGSLYEEVAGARDQGS